VSPHAKAPARRVSSFSRASKTEHARLRLMALIRTMIARYPAASRAVAAERVMAKVAAPSTAPIRFAKKLRARALIFRPYAPATASATAKLRIRCRAERFRAALPAARRRARWIASARVNPIARTRFARTKRSTASSATTAENVVQTIVSTASVVRAHAPALASPAATPRPTRSRGAASPFRYKKIPTTNARSITSMNAARTAPAPAAGLAASRASAPPAVPPLVRATH
jgi:hypothetical protein